MTARPMPSQFDIPRTIAIIGGGLSGALVAIQLLRKASFPLQVTMIEPRADLGRGVAYSTASAWHFLNVRAGNMSIFPDQPDDFLKYLRVAVSQDSSPADFVQRRFFGAYVSERLREASLSAAPGVRLQWCQDYAQRVNVDRDGTTRITLSDGNVLTADTVVLATGNNPVAVPFDNPDGVEIISGWSAAACEGIHKDETVLIVGSGLTAVDAVLALAERGHRGKIHVVSRHGRWPLVHQASRPLTLPSDIFSQSDSVLTILRKLRALSRQAESIGDTWQSAFDGFRPHINSVWKRLPESERRRFLRHLKPLWEIHRHRLPPQAASQIESFKRSGQLTMLRGSVLDARRTPEGLIRIRVSGTVGRQEKGELLVHRTIVCTGPGLDFRKTAPPIIRDLVDRNLARVDPASLGLLVSDDYALLQVSGAPSSSLYALGPSIKGSLWETTALPEIRTQARDLATSLVNAVVRGSADSVMPGAMPETSAS
jgi:uncharacterized NAD(P)/FAD-binding protein YdhS